MAANIEIKARVRDVNRVRARVEDISGGPGERIVQEDVFFHCPEGRLKLRILAPDRGELIHYERTDAPGPTRSDYFIHETSNPSSLRNLLEKSLGIRGVVRKVRLLSWVGNTRIHLDSVEGLGDFLELEVVLRAGQSELEGQALASGLMKELGVTDSDLVEVAYVDLQERLQRRPPRRT
jgi:predicted adenylyl cyclase CyaB